MRNIHQNPSFLPKSQPPRSSNMDEQDSDDAYEYQIINEISRGAYGVVYRAIDKKTNTIVAMKEELDGLSPTTITEIETLEALGPHPCIVSFKRVAMSFDDLDAPVYVVMEHMKSDLYRWREETEQPYSLRDIKCIMWRILTGVAFLHDNGIMHRDIKPANILIGQEGEIKICDFGLAARFDGPAWGRDPEVGTLCYKAPELLKGSHTYACEVDMWSVGCVMAELVMDDVMFPGETEVDQLDRIDRCVKPPFLRVFLKQKLAKAALKVEAAAALTEVGFDLLRRLLTYEPEKRITAREALEHAWFREN